MRLRKSEMPSCHDKKRQRGRWRQMRKLQASSEANFGNSRHAKRARDRKRAKHKRGSIFYFYYPLPDFNQRQKKREIFPP
jgi:hypothetical protein